MSNFDAWLIGGSVMIYLGSAGLLWRYLQKRSGRQPSSPVTKAPPYMGGWLLIAIGTALLFLAISILVPSYRPNPVLWFVAGLALGSCVAVPGLMLALRTTPPKEWVGDAAEHREPWRAYLGWSLVAVGIFGGGVLLPLSVVLLR